MMHDVRQAITKGSPWLLLILVLALLFSAIQLTATRVAASPVRDLKFIPGLVEVGVGHVDETPVNISVACVIEDAQELYGLDVQISWDTEYLRYVDHFYTMPVEDYPDPISPSPYNGTFYEGPEGGINVIKDKVDESGGISGADPDAMYWLSVTEKGVCPEYYGSTTIFVMNFTVLEQCYNYEVGDYLDTLIHFESVDLANSDIPPIHLDYTTEDGTVRLWSVPFTYPPRPKLKVMPETVEGIPVGGVFKSKVWLMGADDGDLDPFWDVQGIDMVMHFNTTMLNATGVTIDPTGWFGGFWPASPPIYEIKKQIDNTLGTVWIAFAGKPGVGGNHTAPYGKNVTAEVTFEVLYEATVTPPPSAPISLENPLGYLRRTTLYGEGLIDLSSPVSTDWTELTSGDPYHLNDWEDNGDGILSESDQIILNNTATGKHFDYHVDKVAGGIEVTVNPWEETETLGTEKNSPKLMFGTPGEFALTYVDLGISSIHVKFANGTERDLDPSEYTEYVDETKVDIDVYLDSLVVENMTLGVDCELPWVEYPSGNCASEIVGIHAYFPDDTERDLVYNEDYYYDSDWPCEIEMDIADPDEFVDGTILEVTYWGLAEANITYDATDPITHRYMEYNGTYTDFLAAISSPNETDWNELYPYPILSYHVNNWTDNDDDGTLNAGDSLVMEEKASGNIREWNVDSLATDVLVSQKECICTVDPSHEFYCERLIVDVAGFPHPERDMCPWHNSDGATPLPHVAEGATFTAIPEFPTTLILLISLGAMTAAVALSKKKTLTAT